MTDGVVPAPVFLELVDPAITSGQAGLMPTQVLLNGVPLAVAPGKPVVLHEIVVEPGQLVTATLTLVVSALTVRPAATEPRRAPRPPRLL